MSQNVVSKIRLTSSKNHVCGISQNLNSVPNGSIFKKAVIFKRTC